MLYSATSNVCIFLQFARPLCAHCLYLLVILSMPILSFQFFYHESPSIEDDVLLAQFVVCLSVSQNVAYGKAIQCDVQSSHISRSRDDVTLLPN